MSAQTKRAKGNWQQGKRYKEQSARSERQFSRSEVQQQLAEAEENYLERYHKGKRTRNSRARLEYRVKWYEQALARHSPLGDSWMSYLRSGLETAKRQLKKLKEEEEKK